MRTFQFFVAHHSASPLRTTLADIRKWHVEENGWADIGYHRIVDRWGTKHAGRPVGRGGAHVRGKNGRCYAVCGIGNNLNPRSAWRPAQWAAISELWEAAQQVFPGIILVGHKDLVRPGSTECPGLDIRAELLGPNRRTLEEELEEWKTRNPGIAA